MIFIPKHPFSVSNPVFSAISIGTSDFYGPEAVVSKLMQRSNNVNIASRRARSGVARPLTSPFGIPRRIHIGLHREVAFRELKVS